MALLTFSTEQADAVRAALRAMLPETVAVAVRPTAQTAPPPYPAEQGVVANAVPRRQQEFAAGRAAARTAMAALEFPASAIATGADRAPVWPAGLIGSISHTDTICAAVVAPARALRSIGIDLELDADLPSDVLEAICTTAERAWLSGLPPAQQGRAARLIFCAKEAFFKAQYPVTGAMIGFDAACITPDIAAGRFTLTICNPIGEFAAGAVIAGQAARVAEHLACTVVLGHADLDTDVTR